MILTWMVYQMISHLHHLVGTLIFESPDRQVVRILIVSFPKHQLRNANLLKGCSEGSGPTASLMIKLEKNMEREKSSGGVPKCIPSLVGDLFYL